MSKRNKIIYWIATVWLSLGMLSTGIVQLLKIKEETDFIVQTNKYFNKVGNAFFRYQSARMEQPDFIVLRRSFRAAEF